LKFARDRTFQQHLEMPLVKLALDIWGGKDASHLKESDLDAIRMDPGVLEIYPQMKAFEAVCDKYKIGFPVDHILAGKTELSEEAVARAFGPDFVALHHSNHTWISVPSARTSTSSIASDGSGFGIRGYAFSTPEKEKMLGTSTSASDSSPATTMQESPSAMSPLSPQSPEAPNPRRPRY
jgi:hypothetical protein